MDQTNNHILINRSSAEHVMDQKQMQVTFRVGGGLELSDKQRKANRMNEIMMQDQRYPDLFESKLAIESK